MLRATCGDLRFVVDDDGYGCIVYARLSERVFHVGNICRFRPGAIDNAR